MNYKFMADKRSKLIARSKETIRVPLPSRLEADRARKKGYRVVAVSLYTPEADWIDRTTTDLRKAGNSKANRSLVVREAILRLQEEVSAKDPGDILKDFSNRQAKRARNSTS
jgi:hypothetical protein